MLLPASGQLVVSTLPETFKFRGHPGRLIGKWRKQQTSADGGQRTWRLAAIGRSVLDSEELRVKSYDRKLGWAAWALHLGSC